MQPKRIIASLLVVILALCSVGISVSAEDSTTLDMAVEVSSSTALSDSLCAVQPGDTVSVSVTIKSNPGVCGISFDLLYDANALAPVTNTSGTADYKKGTLFASGGATETVVVSEGNIKYTMMGFYASTVKNYTGTGVVLSCDFTVKSTFHGSTAITLDMDQKDALNKDYKNLPVTITYGTDASATLAVIKAHRYNANPSKVASTCAAKGTLRYTCSGCSEIIAIPDPEAELVPHTEVSVPSVKPSCLVGGLTEGVKCSVCNTMVKEQLPIPASEAYHVSVVTAAAVAPTCTATGLTEASYCSVCQKTLSVQEIVPVGDHTYGEWVVDEEHAIRSRTCSVCDDVDTELYTAPSQPADNNLVVILLIVLIAVIVVLGVGGFCLYWFVIRKKKVV